MGIYTIEPNQVFAILDFETTGLANESSKPIEIGIIFIDSKLNILQKYSSLINWWGDYRQDFDYKWLKSEKEAFLTHYIPKEYVVRKGKKPKEIVEDINEIMFNIDMDNYNHIMSKKNDPIIISDNPFFDVYFLQKLFGRDISDIPFHYNAWSTMPLLPLCGIKVKKPHRALKDCQALYEGLKMSVNKMHITGMAFKELSQ